MIPKSKFEDFPAYHMVRTGRIVRLIGRITFLLLILFIVAMIFVPWRQTARGYGMVVAKDPQQRAQVVVSPAKGVVSWVKAGIREGTYVTKDTELLRLTPIAADLVEQQNNQIRVLKEKEASAIDSMNRAKENETNQVQAGRNLSTSLDKELEATKQKWNKAKQDVLAAEAELNDKQNQLAVAEKIFPQGLISNQALVSKQQAVKVARAKYMGLEASEQEQYENLLAKEEEIEAKKQEISIKNQDASIKVFEAMQKLNTVEKELLEIQQKRAELDRLTVKAPRSGVILEWQVIEGSDTFKEGDKLFKIVPVAEEIAVEMVVSGNDMPLLKPGERVRLQFEGWPAVQFVGWPSVAVGTFGGKVDRIYPADDGYGNFKILVIPDSHLEREDGWPDDDYLRQGVRANGWVLLDEVSLGYEIWRQMNGFPPTVSQEDRKADSGKDAKGGFKLKMPKP